MNDIHWDAMEPERSRLRALVERVSTELSALVSSESSEPGARRASTDRLTGAWTVLVEQLALGPEPSLRRCPFCRRSVLRVAVRCRYCMKKSSPAESGPAQLPDASSSNPERVP